MSTYSKEHVKQTRPWLAVGKSLAFMEVTITTVKGGRLVAKGSHTKFLPGLKKLPPASKL